MAEYVKREAGLSMLNRYFHNMIGEDTKTLILDIKQAFIELPYAEAEPVKHGQWELRHEGYGHYWECSVCHTNPCICVTKDTKFCPNCGAKMDLEEGKEK